MQRLIMLPLAALILLSALAAPPVAFAQDGGPTPIPVTDDQVNQVAKQLYCPVCPNTPLDVCETQACQDWRAQIKDQLGQGWTEQQIMDYFVVQYGERVLAEPKRSGFTSLVWLLPVVALVLGVVALAQVGRSWLARRSAQSAGTAAAAPTAPDIPPDVLARLEKELREIA